MHASCATVDYRKNTALGARRLRKL